MISYNYNTRAAPERVLVSRRSPADQYSHPVCSVCYGSLEERRPCFWCNTVAHEGCVVPAHGWADGIGVYDTFACINCLQTD